MRNETPVPGSEKSAAVKLGLLLWRALKLEILGYLSIARFLLRRKGIPPGGKAFTYHAPSAPVLAVFIVVSAIEVVVVDLLVQRWPAVRITMLVIDIWGLMYILGLLFGFLTRPHVVTREGLTLRRGPEVNWPITWDAVAVVTKVKHSTNGERGHWLTRDHQGQETLNMFSNGETNMLIELEGDQEFYLPGRKVTTRRVRFYVDKPTEFMDAVRPFLTAA